MAKHPDRNVLRSALTGDPIELIDCPAEGFELAQGDILLVASDGLDTLDDEAIRERMERHHSLPADGIVDKLLVAVRNAKKHQESVQRVISPNSSLCVNWISSEGLTLK